MSGHSKWATTKHRKGAQDKARAKVFAKLIRQVEVAAREGGGDINSNASLRTMYQKARSASVPLDTIEKAIKRGTGELEGVRYESVTYEGYAPGGVAVIVEALTDNRNRTGADMRNTFSKNGGSMAEPGAVAWQFERRGVLIFPKTLSEDDLLEAALEAAGFTPESFEPSLEPTQLVPVTDETEAKKVLRLLEAIDDLDDVQAVHANVDIPDEILATYEG